MGKGSGPHPEPKDVVQRRRYSRDEADYEMSARESMREGERPTAESANPLWPPYFGGGGQPVPAAPRPPGLAESEELPTAALVGADIPTDRHRLGDSEDRTRTDELPVLEPDTIPTRVLVADPHPSWSDDALGREASMLSLHLTPQELRYLAAKVGVDWRSLGGPDAGKAEKCGRLMTWAEEAGQRDALLAAARRASPSKWASYDGDAGFPVKVRPPRRTMVASDDARRVARLLSAHYPLGGLAELATRLLQRRGVDWDDLGSGAVGKSERIHTLVAYAEREGFLHALMASARELDPAPWLHFDSDPGYPPQMEVPARAHGASPAVQRAAAVLSRRYSEDELRRLTQVALDGLGVDWDDFGGTAVGRSERALRLACWAEHVGLLRDVLEVARQIKPGAWEEAVPAGPPVLPEEHPALDIGDLRIALTLMERFSRAKLKELAHDVFRERLGLDWTDFGGPGTTKREWVERVVWYAREVGLLNILLGLARGRA